MILLCRVFANSFSYWPNLIQHFRQTTTMSIIACLTSEFGKYIVNENLVTSGTYFDKKKMPIMRGVNFQRRIKNKLRTIEAENLWKIKNTRLSSKFTGSYKKRVCNTTRHKYKTNARAKTSPRFYVKMFQKSLWDWKTILLSSDNLITNSWKFKKTVGYCKTSTRLRPYGTLLDPLSLGTD